MNGIYGTAIVDGYAEKVGNYKVEPPSLFRGRGEHPKTGGLKRRIRPEDIVLNIGKGVPIPPAPAGHKWKGIVHNNKVTWLCYWQDNINKDYKYVYLAPSSKFKGESDVAKFTKAQTLKKYIGSIRKNYNGEMVAEDMMKRQRGTAVYALDYLALRVGNEKDLSESADTVGLCSLRVEHIDFPAENKIHLYFLGKDSMVYDNTVEVPEVVFKNLKAFVKNKKPKDDVFDKLEPSTLNEHLKSLMPGLSAKVFRTYNASITLQHELFEKHKDTGEDVDVETPENNKILFYNRANREVAILCNHQRSVPKAFDGQMEKMVERHDEIKEQMEMLNAHVKRLKAGKEELTNRKCKVEKNETFKLPTTMDACKAKIEKTQKALENYETKMTLKSDTKTVALGTSKINYMDPRITVAWCKQKDVPLEKIFNKSLCSKFPWAVEVPNTWRF